MLQCKSEVRRKTELNDPCYSLWNNIKDCQKEEMGQGKAGTSQKENGSGI